MPLMRAEIKENSPIKVYTQRIPDIRHLKPSARIVARGLSKEVNIGPEIWRFSLQKCALSSRSVPAFILSTPLNR